MDGLRLGKVDPADKVKVYRHHRTVKKRRASQEPIHKLNEPKLPAVSKYDFKRSSVAQLDRAQVKE